MNQCGHVDLFFRTFYIHLFNIIHRHDLEHAYQLRRLRIRPCSQGATDPSETYTLSQAVCLFLLCCFSCFQIAWNQDTVGCSGCSVALSCPCFWGADSTIMPSFMRVERWNWHFSGRDGRGRRRLNSVDSWTRGSCRRANIWGLQPEIMESRPHINEWRL